MADQERLQNGSIESAIESIYPFSRGIINSRLSNFIRGQAKVGSLTEASQFPYREDVLMSDGFEPSILIEVDSNTHVVVHAVSEEYFQLFMNRFAVKTK